MSWPLSTLRECNCSSVDCRIGCGSAPVSDQKTRVGVQILFFLH